MQTGLPVETPFMRQMYDAIVALVPADDLIKALTFIYGDDLANTEKPTESDELRLARQFASFHEKVKQLLAVQSERASAPASSGVPAVEGNNAENEN
jgi:hypothetical protein